MSSFYSGDPANYPDEIQLPSDGDGPGIQAADVAVPLEGLADRTANANDRLLKLEALANARLVAMNLLTVSPSGSGDFKAARFDAAYKRWYAVGGAGNIRMTSDLGMNWSNASQVSGTEDCADLDVDEVGTVVVTTNSRYAWVFYAGAWSKVDVWGATINGQERSAVVYDRVHARWVVITDDSIGGNTIVKTTTVPAGSWGTASAKPAGWTTSLSSYRLRCSKVSGRIAASALTGGASSMLAYSDNGGLAFTSVGQVAHAFVPENAALVGSAEDGVLFYVVSTSAGSRQTEIWRSFDDGANWQLYKSFVGITLLRPAPLGGGRWVGVALVTLPNNNAASASVFSINGGYTWAIAQHITGTAIGAHAGDGGALLLTSSYAYHSLRVGVPTWQSFT